MLRGAAWCCVAWCWVGVASLCVEIGRCIIPTSSGTETKLFLIKWVACCSDVWCLVWELCVCRALRAMRCVSCVALRCVALRCVVLRGTIMMNLPCRDHGIPSSNSASCKPHYDLVIEVMQEQLTNLSATTKYVRHKPSLPFHLNTLIRASHWLFTVVPITAQSQEQHGCM